LNIVWWCHNVVMMYISLIISDAAKIQFTLDHDMLAFSLKRVHVWEYGQNTLYPCMKIELWNPLKLSEEGGDSITSSSILYAGLSQWNLTYADKNQTQRKK
jgi:hypothetical protein